jgi:hypothetical protein
MNLIQDFQCRVTYRALVEMLSPFSLYLSMKEGSLFCFVDMIFTELDASDCVLGIFGKLSTRRGAWA